MSVYACIYICMCVYACVYRQTHKHIHTEMHGLYLKPDIFPLISTSEVSQSCQYIA